MFEFRDIDGDSGMSSRSNPLMGSTQLDSHNKSSVNVFKSFSNVSSSLLKDPKLNRRNPLNEYEKPVSDRESWWRSTLKDTPLPGAYNSRSFVHEILKKPNTYRFKTDGRRHEPMPHIGRGAYLMPGAYGFEDFSQRVKNLKISYGFKNNYVQKGSKSSTEKVSPFSYDTNKYMSIDSGVEPVRHSFFKSKERRELFMPKEGPPPGEYEPVAPNTKIEISSCFKSKNSRFPKNETDVPGPGTYQPISACIDSKQYQNFATKGVFFTPSAKIRN